MEWCALFVVITEELRSVLGGDDGRNGGGGDGRDKGGVWSGV